MRGTYQIAIVDADKIPDPLEQRKYEWGEVVKNVKVFTCHKAQLDILRSNRKFTFAFAGSGGGKTCLIGLWLYKQVTKKPKGRFLVVTPTESTFRSSQLKQHILTTFEGSSYHGRWSPTDKTYYLPTGGEIVIKTVSDGGDWQKLTGGQYDAAVADECYLLTEEVWEEIRRRVSNRNGQILAVTTPTGNNWIYEIKQRAEQGDKDYYIRHWSKIANPTVSTEDLEREKRLMSKTRYARMIEGQFAAYEGLIYDCFSDPTAPDYPVIVGDALKDGFPKGTKPVRFLGGNDWGYNPDPASQLMIAECEDGVMYVVDEVYGTDITPDDLAKRARGLIDRWAVKSQTLYEGAGAFTYFYSDTSRPEQLQMFRRAAVPIRNKRVTDILAGIAITDQWFRAGRLKVFGSCKNLIRECRGYVWDKDRQGGLKDKPKGKNDHSCDALRYAISSHKYGVAIQPLTPQVNDEEKEREAEQEKLERYGMKVNESLMKELAVEDRNKRLYELAFGDLDDD